jgi:hypothetical protein
MILQKSKLLEKYSLLQHSFTTRDGGVSISPYSSLNLAFHVKDKRERVIQNHQLLANKLHYKKENLIHMKQIHSAKVIKVNEKYNFNNSPTCDALITDKKETPLMVMVADCSPILFYDSVQKVIAVAHAGRQGAFLNIIKNVIDAFKESYNSNPKDIVISVGASICQNCYEVNKEIFEEAVELGYGLAIYKKDKHYFLDIRSILKKQLRENGIKEEHIEISDECSFCSNEKYFSYRADGVTGRFAGLIMMS